MKIGILTYHRAHNYGALLQAYALLKYLKGLGHQAEIIDYWPKYHEEDYKLIPYFRSRRLLGKIKAILLLIIGYKRTNKRSELYKKFIKDQLNLSEKVLYDNENDLNKIDSDIVVYGSDQIWRRSDYPDFKGYSDVFFGASLPKVKRKITYAASMGIIDIDEKDEDYLKKMLLNFDEISVREQDLKVVVETLVERKIQLVLDPVFLLEKNDWIKLSSISNTIIKEKYIFFYQLTPSEEAIQFTNRLKEHYGYKVIEIRGRVEPLLFGNRYMQTQSPIDFISLIQNAEIVVSSSFHGVAFSLLLEKQFYCMGMKNNSGRVTSLLDSLDVSDRLVSNLSTFDFDKKINYQILNRKLSALKTLSENYLVDSLNASNI